MKHPQNWPRTIAGPLALGAACLLLGITPVRAQLTEDAPDELDGVGIEEHLDETLPLELTFFDEDGQEVALGSFFRDGHPVALNLVYFNCPMLCNVFLDGFTRSLQGLDWTPGQEFDVVTVSIDPNDDAAGATAKRERYVEELGRPEAKEGWHFLTGSQENITALANAVGFKYRLDDMSGEYQHTTAVFLSTPEGRLSRYLYGVMFDPQTLRLSLVEASNGRIGTATDQLLLFCFSYDHTAGKYGPAAMNLMRAFGALCVVCVGAFVALNVRSESRRKRAVTLGA